MNRFSATLCLALLALPAAPALAQLRPIPADAKAGTLEHVEQMDVRLNGRRTRLSPGAQIRDTQNRLVLPAHLPGPVKVRYTLDAAGFVHRVWILSAEEARPAPAWN